MEKQKKKHRGLKVLICVIVLLAVFVAGINIVPPKKVTSIPMDMITFKPLFSFSVNTSERKSVMYYSRERTER